MSWRLYERERVFFFFYEVCLSLVLINAARWLLFYGGTGEDCIIFMEEVRGARFAIKVGGSL